MAVDLPVPVVPINLKCLVSSRGVDGLASERQAVLSLRSRAFGFGSEQRTALVSCSGHSIACK